MKTSFPLRLLLLTLLGLLVLCIGLNLTASRSLADNEPTDFTLWMDGRMIGSEADLSPEPRGLDSESKSLQTNQANALEEVGNWTLILGEKLILERDVSFKLHFNTSAIHEIEAVVYYSFRDQMGNIHELGDIGATVGPGFPQTIEGDTIIEATGNLDSEVEISTGSKFIMNVWVRIEYNRMAQPGSEDANIWWNSQARDSHSQFNGQMIFLEDNRTIFDNQRVDEGDDKLFIKVNITSAFGADDELYNDLDFESATLTVEDVEEGGDIRDLSIVGKDYIAELSAYWYYQNDRAKEGTYSFIFTITDTRDNTWEGFSDHELEVDYYEVSIALDDIEESDTKQVAKRESANFIFEAANEGNSLDEIAFEISDDSRIPEGWSAELIDYDGPYAVDKGETVSGEVEITPDSTVSGGSYAKIVLLAYSTNDEDNAWDELEVTARMKSYGVELTYTQNFYEIPYMDSDIQNNGFRFNVKIKNTGNDKDTVDISATCTKHDWLVTLLQNDNPLSTITLQSRETQTLEVKVELHNENNGDEAIVTIFGQSTMDPMAADNMTIDLLALVPLEDVINILINDIEVSPETWKEGQDLIVTVTLMNEGGKDAGPFEVQLSEGSVKDTVQVEGLNAMATKEIELIWENPKTGTVEITITVDPRDILNEASRDDNIMVLEFEIVSTGGGGGGDDDDSPGLTLPFAGLTLGTLALARRRKSAA